MGNVVLITGTSTGIGRALALQAAQAGHQVIATMRDTSRAGELADVADVRALDVTSAESVAELIAGVLRDHGRLDVLVNNAGAGHVGTVETDSVEDFQAVLDVNLLGVVRMTRAAMPHLRASGGRLVTVSSVGGIVGQPFNEAYCAAKFAVEGMMESLAPVAAQFGVRVSLVEPGAVATEFVANAVTDRSALLAGMGDYRPVLERYVARTEAAFAAAQTAEEVAAVVLSVVESESPALRYQTSDRARQFVGVKLADLDGSRVLGVTSGMC
ncbi:SDR family oxidoreductase [Longispora sp. K20-0274]|uniref:SDR family oxidoreductase n=1 Tax=Longispora sp. K20-0274 TaxID=3088255 RepID=UPI00399AF00E